MDNIENRSEVFRAKLNLETSQMPWQDMQRYFASGAALYVAPELDLVEVAFQMSEDNSEQIKHWMSDGNFGKVTDAQAAGWYKSNALMWAVVVSPWVLVQPAK